ncbi:MAG: ubiquinol-cytochrome chaperone, partial [Proteobacteria bacterium]|nr:ubiquinol-cytochrome chaperone [Pseudomonadota bacterium]
IRRKAPPRAAAFYEDLMRAARQPVFYAELGVADSVEGRFEMLMLHVGLAVHRLSQDVTGREMARDLSELFIEDMERSLREIGYDDSGLKRRLKKVAGAFYGRMEAMATALASDQPQALVDTLIRNVHGGTADSRHAARLAGYVRDLAGRLADMPVAELAAGALPVGPLFLIPADPDLTP